MNIAVLSGKGGTGKTTVSTNLALLLGANYIDCDVEEPNGFIFLKPENISSQDIKIEMPEIDRDKCMLCGTCAETCQFNALAKGKKSIIIFDKLCHSCGACEIVCPTGALKYTERVTGIIEEGQKHGIMCKRGLLNVGEPIAIPILNGLLNNLPKDQVNLLDSPPGTSCNVVNVLTYADRAILVTEPTAFGLHDLKMAVELAESLNVPYGIIVNKYGENNHTLDEYIEEKKVTLLGTIPYKREIAESYSKGHMLIEIEECREAFLNIMNNIQEVLL